MAKERFSPREVREALADEPRTKGGRINRAAAAKVLRDFARAKELGHDTDNLIAVKVSKTKTGWSSICTCGYSTNPKMRKVTAVSMAYVHVLDVVHDQVPALPEMTGDVPADTPTAVEVPQSGSDR